MEGWRGFVAEEQIKESLFQDHKFITEVLGIEIPLREDGEPVELSEETKKQILNEVAFLRRIWNGAKEWMKSTFKPIADAGFLFFKMIRNKDGEGTEIMKISRKSILQRIINPMRNKLREMLTGLGEKGKKLWLWIHHKLIMPATNEKGVRGLINRMGLAVLFRTVYKYVSDLIPDVPSPSDSIVEKIKEYFSNVVSNLWNKLKSKMGSLDGWLDMAGELIGSVKEAAEALSPWTEASAAFVKTGESTTQDDERAFTEGLLRRNLYNLA